ncbi:MAG: cryptochrome/photolyase CryB [Pararhodobacter sp.]
MVKLVLVLGDQLSHELSSLRASDPESDVVMMAEVMAEATYVPHHPKKIVLVLAAMRKFAEALRRQGWRVLYTRLDDPHNRGDLVGEVRRRQSETGATEVVSTEPGEWRLRKAFREAGFRLLPDTRFLCPRPVFRDWARGRAALRMEFFYRMMRRRTGILMEGDQPAGGKWNFDSENRSPARADLFRRPPLRHAPDAVVRDVMELVAARFPDHFGSLHPFWFPTDRTQALASLDEFITHHLPEFGATQDAMLRSDPFLNHAVLAPALNLGLLSPAEVIAAAEGAWRAGRVPINSAEGFIRQILGWREFVRGVYDLLGPDYPKGNALAARRPLPAVYWGGETAMDCMRAAVAQTRDEAYAHHIQRLMVTGNFALLAGLDPAAVQTWYLAVYADAFEWVEAPNTLGMALYGDGGILTSKPYAASGAYINRMSDYCQSCAYDPKRKSGAHACPFTVLYWDFLMRNREELRANPRKSMMYRNLERMTEAEQRAIRSSAAELLSRLENGEKV